MDSEMNVIADMATPKFSHSFFLLSQAFLANSCPISDFLGKTSPFHYPSFKGKLCGMPIILGEIGNYVNFLYKYSRDYG
jgi:hypothetical protein